MRFSPLIAALVFDFLAAAGGVALAQTKSHQAPGVTVNFSEIADRAERLRAAGLYAPAKQRRTGFPVGKENPGHLRPLDYANPNKLGANEAAAAASVAEFVPRQFAVSPDTPRTLSGFAGLDDNLTAVPPDTMGAVGPQHVVTALNSEILIQDRRGRPLRRVVLEDFWRGAGPLEFATDPRIFFDTGSQRWVACVVADPQTTRSSLYVAISQTADPNGNWNIYRVASDENQWVDFPTLGVTSDWVIITTNNFSLSANRYVQTNVYVFTKSDLVTGRGSFRVFPDINFSGVPAFDPAGSLGGRAAIVSTVGGNLNGQGVVRISEIRGRPGDEQFVSNAATFRLDDTWAFEAGADFQAPQRDSRFRIETNDDRMLSCAVRNLNIWCSHSVFLPAISPNRASIQWFQFAADPAGSYRIASRGLIDDPSARFHFAFPSIAANRNNDVLIGYTRFAADQFASANFVFRAGTDPPGQFQADSVFKPGEASYRRGTGRNRWGDYSNTVVDPVDDLSFWSVQEFAAAPTSGGTSRWNTWWAQVTPVTSPCVFTVSAAAINVPAAGSTSTIRVNARAGCRWMAAPDAGFVTATDGSPGEGDGSVSIVVAANLTAEARTATVTVAGQAITIRQEAGAPAIDLVVVSFSAPSTATIGVPFPVSTRVTNQGNLPSGRFSIGFFLSSGASVSASDLSTGFGCTFANGIEPGQSATCAGDLRIPASIAPGRYQFAAIADPSQAVNLPNRSRATRLSDAGPLTVLAAGGGLTPAISAAGVVHAATAVSTSLSPGLILVIYGANLGPPSLTTLTVNANGVVDSSLAGTQVLIEGVAAPLVYVSATQISAIVPASVAGRTTARLQVIANGVSSEVLTLPVAPAAPGVFTTNFSGRGQGALLNQDNSVNSTARPAARGEVVQIYATGFGLLSMAPPDGAIATGPISIASTNLSVTIGGVPATVLYAGAAPGLVAGVVQINVLVPPTAPAGSAVDLRITLDGVPSASGVTLSVR